MVSFVIMHSGIWRMNAWMSQSLALCRRPCQLYILFLLPNNWKICLSQLDKTSTKPLFTRLVFEQAFCRLQVNLQTLCCASCCQLGKALRLTSGFSRVPQCFVCSTREC